MPQPVVRDAMQRLSPDAVLPRGLLGRRLQASRINRLRHQEEEHLLWPFQRHCPVGYKHPERPFPEILGDWQGEFLGTWLDAACLSAWNAGDAELRAKVDQMVEAWLATQGSDGYLGTYDAQDRWKSWDIWIHAHSLIGLISYYHFTGGEHILQAAQRAADCVLADFGPGKRSVNSTGPHGGMASSAILEPMVWMYWLTGEMRYLDFGRWLADEDWESPEGPRIISSLLGGRGVAGTANGKGIEMLMDFFGLVELYRATGEPRYLQAVLTAWEDIVRRQLYITGSASTGEYFRPDYLLLNDGLCMVGETCVSMGWMYLNFSLGRLTGEARFFDMAEQTIYNHLLAAQSPDGRGWAYYTGLRDSRRYRWHTDPECCPSKGVRALAHIPQHILTITEDGLAVNLYEPLAAQFELPNGPKITLNLRADYPFNEFVEIELSPAQPVEFTLYLRLPGWCRNWQLKVNAGSQAVQPDTRGYLALRRRWLAGDQVELTLVMPPRVLVDTLGNPGRAAVGRGPLVYAADQADLPASVTLDDVILALDSLQPSASLEVQPDSTRQSVHLVAQRLLPQAAAGDGFWSQPERYHDLATPSPAVTYEPLRLVPFFEAGTRDPKNYKEGIHVNWEPVTHITYQVWLPYRLI